jgi:hypothetical protein
MISACHSSYAQCRFFTALGLTFIFPDLQKDMMFPCKVMGRRLTQATLQGDYVPCPPVPAAGIKKSRPKGGFLQSGNRKLI